MRYNPTLKRIRRERAAVERLAPSNRAGNLYYIKLETEFGPFYKLGFTKASSVLERFSYGESINHELIEKVLLFVPLDDGFDVETRLHDHFSAKKSFGIFSSIPDMPLYRDGQSELYYEDILGLDEKFSRIKHLFTWLRVTYHAGKKEYKSGLITVVVMAAMTALCLAILMLIFPLSWLADWLSSDEKASHMPNKTNGNSKRAAMKFAKLLRG